LAATFSVTFPEPLPVEPDATVIHDDWLAAVHVQPASTSTLTATVPPLIGVDVLEGLTRN
jgi:hypothetical protein